NVTGSTGSMTATNQWQINNQGTVTFNPVSPFALDSAATISNNGAFNIQNSNGIGISTDNLSTPQFTNTNLGTVTKSAGGVSPIGVAFINAGTTTVNAGTLRLHGGGSSANPSFFNNSGTIAFNAGTY